MVRGPPLSVKIYCVNKYIVVLVPGQRLLRRVTNVSSSVTVSVDILWGGGCYWTGLKQGLCRCIIAVDIKCLGGWVQSSSNSVCV